MKNLEAIIIDEEILVEYAYENTNRRKIPKYESDGNKSCNEYPERADFENKKEKHE